MISTPFFFSKSSQALGPAFFQRKPLLLSLDFDGTLAPIAPTPAQARMPEPTRKLLVSLSQRPQTYMALLSGRALPDLKRKARLPRTVYVGNHGMDFFPSTLGWGGKALEDWHHVSRRSRDRLVPFLRQWPGTFLEDKGWDLSVHYRALPVTRAHGFVESAVQTLEKLPVACHSGKKVLEVRPQGAPNKAQALARLIARYRIREKNGVCLYIGDDRTDEDVFKAFHRLKNFTGFKVGRGETRAHFRLRNTLEVRRFLTLFTLKTKYPREVA